MILDIAILLLLVILNFFLGVVLVSEISYSYLVIAVLLIFSVCMFICIRLSNYMKSCEYSREDKMSKLKFVYCVGDWIDASVIPKNAPDIYYQLSFDKFGIVFDCYWRYYNDIWQYFSEGKWCDYDEGSMRIAGYIRISDLKPYTPEEEL